MIDIFETFAPIWRLAVSRYARDLWNNGVTQKTDAAYDHRAIIFSREYRYALESHYRKKKMSVYRGTVDGWVNEWLQKQQALKDTLKIISEDKKNILVQKEIEKLERTEDAQKMINRLYDAKENETVYKVFSYKEYFKDLAEQHGDESAYDLGTGINERIIQQFSDRYFWRTQKDKRVRNTHEQLLDKCFLFSDPPTTVDKYGNKHTGNPGSDWGCRCWSDPADKSNKPLRGYVVHER